jgi:hypothetical protein
MTCGKAGGVDRHFAGRLGTAGEEELRRHLPECADCTARYRAQLAMERLDPRAAGAKARLRRALGLPAPRRRTWQWLALPSLAAAALLLIVAGGDRGFLARGGSGPAALEIYRPHHGQVEAVIRPGDELAFAYRNLSKKSRLLLFGVDEHRHVFWYHPAWVQDSDEPVAIPLQRDAALHELPEAIAQPLDGRELRIVAWFLDEPLSVKQAEALIAKDRTADGAVTAERRLRVEPSR